MHEKLFLLDIPVSLLSTLWEGTVPVQVTVEEEENLQIPPTHQMIQTVALLTEKSQGGQDLTKDNRKGNQKVRKIPPPDQDQGRMIEAGIITQGRLIPAQGRVQIAEAGQDRLTKDARDQDLPSETENLMAGCTRTGSQLIYPNDTDHGLPCLIRRPTGVIEEATPLAMMTEPHR